jgi:hypothetical protein
MFKPLLLVSVGGDRKKVQHGLLRLSICFCLCYFISYTVKRGGGKGETVCLSATAKRGGRKGIKTRPVYVIIICSRMTFKIEFLPS